MMAELTEHPDSEQASRTRFWVVLGLSMAAALLSLVALIVALIAIPRPQSPHRPIAPIPPVTGALSQKRRWAQSSRCSSGAEAGQPATDPVNFSMKTATS